MSIVFNGVTLDPNLIWTDRYDHTPIAQTTHRTLEGTLIVFPKELLKGQIITLEATDSAGWFTKAMMISIKSFADVAGATYILDFHGENYNVMFNHEVDPVVSFTALRPIEPQGISDPFSGTINLVTI